MRGCLRQSFPRWLKVLLLAFLVVCVSGAPVLAATYTISGIVRTAAGTAIPGVTMTLSGDATSTAATNINGQYAFPTLANGSYTITPSKAGYSFNPLAKAVTISGARAMGQNFTGAPYTISGKVKTARGAPMVRVLVTLSGGGENRTQATDIYGNYSFKGVANGGYTVTPAKSGFAFSPVNRPVTINNANSPGNDFGVTFGISGTVTASGVGLSGVTVALSGAASRTTTTDGSGTYSFSGLANGGYTVTPSRSGYAFTPPSSPVTITNSKQTADFTATFTGYSISGTVTASGVGLSGVTVSLSGAATATTTTDGSGTYSFSGLANGSYTVTPTKTGFAFTPPSSPVTITNSNQTADFTATFTGYSISGTVTASGVGLSGVTVALSGAATGTTTTDGSGNYSFSGLANGSYTVTPSKTGYAFGPVNRSVTITNASSSGHDFGVTFSISGTITASGVGLSGVTVALSGAATATTTTDGSGTYSFSDLANGGYTVTPSRSGYAFTPPSSPVTITNANLTADFTSTFTGYSISGTVMASGVGLAGVTVALSGAATATTTTDGSGTYSFSDLANGGYTVTPSKIGFAFTPVNRSVTVNNANSPGNDFGVTFTISGTVTASSVGLSGVTVALSGAASRTTTTDGSGNYSFSGLANGSYTVTPSMAGYAFTPPSSPVTITNADLTANFTATFTGYSISGTITVSSVGLSGVTVALSGAASRTTTTDGSGNYGFSGLANGSYLVSPSKVGYAFTPPSSPVTITNTDLTANFTATFTGYSISGTVTLSSVGLSGVTVALSGAASRTTTTDGSGNYSFSGLANGSYTVTPSLDGASFTPSNRSVTLAGSNSDDNNFVWVYAGYSVSGTVSYTGSKTGWIYITARFSGGGGPGVGTAIASPGAFTIRGLQPGTYVIQAWRDTVGNGVANVADPFGTSAPVTVAPSATGVTVALTDPTLPAPSTPDGPNVFPVDQAAAIVWDSVSNTTTSIGGSGATAYRIYWSQGPGCAVYSLLATVPENDSGVFFQSGLTNGAQYCYKVSSMIGSNESAPSDAVGPVTIGSPAGGVSVSGTVTFSGTATGPLWVVVHSNNGATGTRIASPTSPASYTISGVQPGTYQLFAFIDMNNNGAVDLGDKAVVEDMLSHSVVGSSNLTGQDITLPPGNALAAMPTIYQHNTPFSGTAQDQYFVSPHIYPLVKLPVKVTITSGPNIPVPFDIGNDGWGYGDSNPWIYTGNGGSFGAVPSVGDEYAFSVTYSDSSTETLTASVTGVFDNNGLATPVSPAPGGTADSVTPTFTWSAPANPPAGDYAYRVGVQQSGSFGQWIWDYGEHDDTFLLPPATSILYNVDGNASQPSLTPGASYYWWITVKDGNQNEGSNYSSFTAPM
jgi:hypothetical protein